TLKTLQLDLVGLYIVEMDTAFNVQHILPQGWNGKYLYHETDLCAKWKDLGACQHAGLTKSLGVSNFNKRQLELILKKPGLKHRLVSNQVDIVWVQNGTLQNDIVKVGYSSIGTSRDASWVNMTCPPLYKKTTAQMSLWFNIQRGVVVIPKSSNPQPYDVPFLFPSYLPMKIFYFSLPEAEKKAMEDLNKNIRFVELLIDHPEYPFHDNY
uniref:NADP-dependent oxidoreductase domain-containing protein n=1 Tax=Salmo trutta TaxID=8032 RepID=A0A674DBE6_SALTR